MQTYVVQETYPSSDNLMFNLCLNKQNIWMSQHTRALEKDTREISKILITHKHQRTSHLLGPPIKHFFRPRNFLKYRRKIKEGSGMLQYYRSSRYVHIHWKHSLCSHLHSFRGLSLLSGHCILTCSSSNTAAGSSPAWAEVDVVFSSSSS